MASRFPPAAAGVLMAIGGAEDKLGDKAVLARFVRLAGGGSARVLIVSTASSLGDEITDLYRTVFTELGVAEIDALRPRTREQAEQPATAAAVERASGIFLTGGNQHRLVLVSGAVLHALPAGYRFDLAARKLLPRPATLDLDEHPRRSPRRLAKAIAAEGAEDRTPRRRRPHRTHPEPPTGKEASS